MPNPATHMEMAYHAAQLVDAPVLNENMGCYLLGSTAPDVRVITRKGREPYHFAPLDFDEVGAGIAGLYGEHPQLVETVHGPTRSFMAGYMTHLILDRDVDHQDVPPTLRQGRGVRDGGGLGPSWTG